MTTPNRFTEFSTLLGSFPFSPREENAKGVLAPIFKATGHILFVLAGLAAGDNILTMDEAKVELRHAREHMEGLDLDSVEEVLSAASFRHLAALKNAFSLTEYFENWSADQRAAGLRDLANRTSGVLSFLDRELVGLPPDVADPGRAL